MIDRTRLSVLLAVLVAGVTLLGAQVVTRSDSGGIAASSVVNLDSTAFSRDPAFGYVRITGSEPLIVYEVPPDRWLLVSDVEIAGDAFELIEIDGTASLVKRSLAFTFGVAPDVQAYHSSVGLAFPPGSQVAIRNVTSTVQLGAFTLTGYLTTS